MTGFQEKPRPDEARSNLANCGVYVIEPELLARIPEGTPFDFGRDLWPSLVAANEPLYAYTTMSYWNDVGDLDELRNSILDAVRGHVRVDIPGREVTPGIWMGPSCSIDSTATLEPPLVLGRNVRIGPEAQVRGPAAIGADCDGRREGGDPAGGAPARAASCRTRALRSPESSEMRPSSPRASSRYPGRRDQ